METRNSPRKPQSSAQDPHANPEALLRALAATHARMVDEIAAALRPGETGILEAGNLLGTVVREALSQGNEMGQMLASTRATQIAEALESEAMKAQRHMRALDGILSELAEETRESLQATRTIHATLRGFRKILVSIDAVSVSLRIEIARLSCDRDFQVVIDPLRTLSGEIQSLSDDVENFTAALAADLPALDHSVNRAKRARDAVGKDVSNSVSELTRATTAIGHAATAAEGLQENSGLAIRRRCEEALSKLQFFDPMAQELQCVDAEVASLLTKASAWLGLNQSISPLRYAERVGSQLSDQESTEAPAAGEVLLF